MVLMKRAIRAFLSGDYMSPVGKWYSGICSCVMYHRIIPDDYSPPEFWPNGPLCVRASAFEDQIAWMKENFRVYTACDMIESLQRGECDTPSVVITFDDGYLDNLNLALPILEKYQIPATIFISTGFLDGTACLWWMELEYALGRLEKLDLDFDGESFHFDLRTSQRKHQAYHLLDNYLKGVDLHDQLRFMEQIRRYVPEPYSYEGSFVSWDQLRELDRHPLVTIGAHTVNHPALSLLSPEEMEAEVVNSVERLEVELGHKVELFSYPFGDRGRCGEREFRFVENSSLRAAFTTRPAHIFEQHKEHLGALPRVAIVHDDDMARVRWKLSGREAIVAQRGKRFVTS